MGKSASSTKSLRAAHAKSIHGLAWSSFVIALADGALLPGTFIGQVVVTALDWLPTEYGIQIIAKILLLVFGWVAVFLDCYIDLEPNQLAVAGALLLPSVAMSMSGGMAQWTQNFAHVALDFIDQWLFAAFPSGVGSTALAIGAAAAALLMAHRVVKKSRNG